MCIVLFDLDERVEWMGSIIVYCIQRWWKALSSTRSLDLSLVSSGEVTNVFFCILTTWSTDGFSQQGIGDGDGKAIEDSEWARKDCFPSVLEGFRASLIQDIMQAFCTVVLDVITPSDSGLTPEKWRCDATICPPNWPIDYRLLRGWYLSTNLHEFASGMFSPLQSWKLTRHAAFFCARNSNPCGSGCSGCHGVMLEMTMCASKQVHDLIHAPVL